MTQTSELLPTLMSRTYGQFSETITCIFSDALGSYMYTLKLIRGVIKRFVALPLRIVIGEST